MFHFSCKKCNAEFDLPIEKVKEKQGIIHCISCDNLFMSFWLKSYAQLQTEANDSLLRLNEELKSKENSDNWEVRVVI